MREKKKREEERLQLEREERERERTFQYEMAQLQSTRSQQEHSTGANRHSASLPKIQSFEDGKDDLHSYLQRFERYANNCGWPMEEWALSLSALLTGKALDVYSRLDEDAANDYNILRESLLKRYDLNELGYLKKFRTNRPEDGETPQQYIWRLKSYFKRWIELSGTEETYDTLFDLMLQEQYVSASPRNLRVFLRERKAKSLHELASLSEDYLNANEITLSKLCNQEEKKNIARSYAHASAKEVTCYKCNRRGHFAFECKLDSREGSSQRRYSYESDNCKNLTRVAVVQEGHVTEEQEELGERTENDYRTGNVIE